MKVWHLVVALLVAGSLGLLASCGDNGDVDDYGAIAFTPLPTPTPVPKLCGNGAIDAGFEQCEEDGDCTGGKSCVCCLCLGDGEELGERTFTIARPPSKFLSTGLAGGDVSTRTWLPGPLVISAGRPDPDLPGEEACSAPLSLKQSMPDGTEVDGAIFGFGIIDGSTLCNKLYAGADTPCGDGPDSGGSSGVIDCDGGTAHGVEFMQNSNGPAEEDPPTLTTGLGDPVTAGPGAATLLSQCLVSIRIPLKGGAPIEPADVCLTEVDYDDPYSQEQIDKFGLELTDITVIPVAFTTETGTAVVTNPLLSGGTTGAEPIVFSVTGGNLSCAAWTETDGVGTLAGPISGLDQVVGDTANGFLLTDQPQQP